MHEDGCAQPCLHSLRKGCGLCRVGLYCWFLLVFEGVMLGRKGHVSTADRTSLYSF
jgi:hypothetical protein